MIDRLLACEGVDQVIWSDENGGLNQSRDAVFCVETRDRGRLKFQLALNRQAQATDELQTPWAFTGDLSAVDAEIGDDNTLRFGDYPNALERIAAGFFEMSGNLWVTSRLGREFCLPEIKTHRGGSHGSLHKEDSSAPLIAAGLPDGYPVPQALRTVDLAPMCLEILGLTPPRRPGASAVMAP